MSAVLGRRAALALPALLLPPSVRAAPAGGYNWRIMREDRQVGTHRVGFSGSGATRTARTVVDIAIRLAGFTVFRFAHEYSETWDGARLAEFRSHAERQGREVRCLVHPGEDELVAEGAGAAAHLPRDAAPLSWWDPAALSRPLFDTSTGQLVRARPQRTNDGWRQPDPPYGEARYDAAGTWVGYAARGDDGTPVRYEPA